MAKDIGRESTQGTSNFNTQGFWSNSENPFLNYSTLATDSMKEIWGWQVKTSQVILDHSVRMGQTLADFAHTQAQEAARVTQEGWKNSAGLAETVRKSFFDLTDKVKRN